MEQLVVLTLLLSHLPTFFPLIFRFPVQASSQSISIFLILLYESLCCSALSLSPFSFIFCSGRMDAGKMDGFKPRMGNEKVVKREATEDYEEKIAWLGEDKKKIGVGSVGGGSGSGKKGSSGGGGSGTMRCCQADKCTADLSDAKQYHRRHKVCEYHAKAQAVLVGGIRQRFCQQCSRFHELAEFDDTKRSCRRRLAGHNERRRKNSESQSEGSSRKLGPGPPGTQLKDTVCEQADDRGRIQKTIQENATYKHFQIR